jgi:hypothetical protein
MPTEDRRANFAQLALDTYTRVQGTCRRSRWSTGEGDVAESDIVDLMTDLLLLARFSGYDPQSVVSKAERHLYAETGHHYGP